MYTTKNYKTLMDLKKDFKAGKDIEFFQPGYGPEIKEGRITLEGPHYCHKWYASAIVKEGKIVSIK